MLELVTISNIGSEWYLNKTIVNPNHIVMITDSREHNSLLKEGKIDLNFNSQIKFSKVQMAAISGFSELIVIGSPSAIMEKVNKNKKQLLKG